METYTDIPTIFELAICEEGGWIENVHVVIGNYLTLSLSWVDHTIKKDHLTYSIFRTYHTFEAPQGPTNYQYFYTIKGKTFKTEVYSFYVRQ